MGYNKQWENYTEKYQKLCMENDVIPDSLFILALPIFQELIPFV